MQVARPSGGFKIVVREIVRRYIDSETDGNQRIRQFWTDILSRIAITGLREGTKLKGHGLRFLFIAEGAPDFFIPSIKIVYECFGDTLTVTAALVMQEADYEADDDSEQNA